MRRHREKDPTKVRSYRSLPYDLGLPDYQLVPQQNANEDLGEPMTTEDGRFIYTYEILRTPMLPRKRRYTLPVLKCHPPTRTALVPAM